MENSFIHYHVEIEYTREEEEHSWQGHLLSPSCVWEKVDIPFWNGIKHRLIDASLIHVHLEKRDEVPSIFGLEQRTFSPIHTRRELLLSLGMKSSNYPLTNAEIEVAHAFAGRNLLLQEVIGAWNQKQQDPQTAQEKAVKQHRTKLLVTLQRLYLQGFFDWHASIAWSQSQLYCKRCGYAQEKEPSSFLTFLTKLFVEEERLIQVKCDSCGKEDCYYCPRCLQLGRAKACEPLLQWAEQTSVRKREVIFQWNGELSPAQQEASNQLVHFVHPKQTKLQNKESGIGRGESERDSHRNEFLVWAVCGAGKTEILFNTIYQSLLQSQKILITSPRRDVILELVPRLQETFPNTIIRTLHAESKEKYEAGELFLATTHQTLRFQDFFDLVIMDEEDAFPYHHDPMLPYAVHRAKKHSAAVVYLTATPRQEMILQVKEKKIEHVLIPERYHGKPLAVPVIQPLGEWRKLIQSKALITPLLHYLTHLVQQQRFGYLFVPHVRDLELVKRYLMNTVIPYLQTRKEHFPRQLIVEVVHAEHPDRTAIVQRFRDKQIDLLITTTILERGVTIPFSDVAVLGSDDSVFDTAALIQIAGRVGRKLEDPIGSVWYFPEARSDSQQRCIKQIKDWNKILKGDRE